MSIMYMQSADKQNWVIVSRGIPIDLKPQLEEILRSNILSGWANSFFYMTVLVPRYQAVQRVLRGQKPAILATITMPEGAHTIPQPIKDFLATENIYPVEITKAENESIEHAYVDIIEPFFHSRPDASLQNYNPKYLEDYRAVSHRFQAALDIFPDDVITSHSDPYLLLVKPRSQQSHDVYNINIPSAHSGDIKRISLENKDLYLFFRDIYANLNKYKSVLFLADIWAKNHQTILKSIGEPITTNIGLIPEGCVSEYTELLQNKSVREQSRLLHQQYSQFSPILSVDRIDPFKGGFIQRIKAFDAAFDEDGGFRTAKPLWLMALKLKEDEEKHELFREYKNKILDVIRGFNQKWNAILNYEPIVVLENQTRPQLSALYKFLAEKRGIFVVSPKSEGAHRGAWEACSVATQVGSPITTIISSHAGALYWLRGAIEIDPFSTGNMSAAFRGAVRMPPDEQNRRHRKNETVVYLHGDTVTNFYSLYLMILLTHQAKLPLSYAECDRSSSHFSNIL